MKKNYTPLLLIGAAAAAAYFYFNKKKETATDTKEIQEMPETQTDEASAVVTAPAGRLQDGIEKAVQIANTIKNAVIAVKSGNKTATVRSGAQAERYKKRKARLAKRKHKKGKKAKIIIQPTETITKEQYEEEA